MTTTADDIRRSAAEAWRAFRAALDDAALEATTSAGWQVREMVAHVAFWMETVPPFVAGAFRGDEAAFKMTFPSGYVAGDDEWPNADTHNAREAAWARQQPGHAVVERAERAADELLRFLESVTDDEVAAHIRYFTEIGGHLDEHRAAELTPASSAGS